MVSLYAGSEDLRGQHVMFVVNHMSCDLGFRLLHVRGCLPDSYAYTNFLFKLYNVQPPRRMLIFQPPLINTLPSEDGNCSASLSKRRYQFHHLQGVEDCAEEPKRTEFKVWSVILSSWSDVPV